MIRIGLLAVLVICIGTLAKDPANAQDQTVFCGCVDDLDPCCTDNSRCSCVAGVCTDPPYKTCMQWPHLWDEWAYFILTETVPCYYVNSGCNTDPPHETCDDWVYICRYQDYGQPGGTATRYYNGDPCLVIPVVPPHVIP